MIETDQLQHFLPRKDIPYFLHHLKCMSLLSVKFVMQSHLMVGKGQLDLMVICLFWTSLKGDFPYSFHDMDMKREVDPIDNLEIYGN